jgi:biotin carboxyl carrier protein
VKKFRLSLASGKEWQAVVKRMAGGVEVMLGSKRFVFLERDLQRAAGSAQIRDGMLEVSTPKLQRAFELRPAAAAGAESGVGENQLKSLFPGKVVKIAAPANGWVNAGDLVLVMESMKMEYHYHAPSRLFIEKVLVKEGEVLPKGKEFFAWHV